MNDYEAKQEARRERLEARAAGKSALADGAAGRSHGILGVIPMGQPILVGHHSERRHRRALERSDREMRKAIDAQRASEELARRAAAVGSGGISADDQDAASKIEATIAQLEAKRAAYKAHNRAAKKSGGEILPSYVLSNLGANIRRYRKRLAALATAAAAPVADAITGDGFEVSEDRDDNRLRIVFDGKPDQATRTLLKRHGFRWAPSVGAWQRQLNNGARYAAECVLRELGGAA